MSIKMLKERLCTEQARHQSEWPGDVRQAVQDLMSLIDTHRPIANNGKHGQQHTPTCGCEDK